MSGSRQEAGGRSQPRLQPAPLLPSHAARDARRMLRPLKRDLLQLLQQLVRTDSVAVPPDGSETAAQKILQKFLKAHGLYAELYDLAFLSQSDHPYVRRERRYAGRHNLIARLAGRGRGRSLLLSGHMDTVPAGSGAWKESPWSGVIRGGRLYGRGSYDMKGGLVAAFAVAVALKRAGRKLGGDLLCESVIDEEWAGGGGTLAGRLRGDIADACVIPEPTDLSIFRASRGGYFFDINVRAGDPRGYFSKDEVVSPAVPLGRLLGWIESWSIKRRQVERGEAYGGFNDPAPVQVLALEANRFDADIPWSVPLTARVRIYFQFLPHEDVLGVIREVRQSLRRFCEQDPFFGVYRPEWKAIVDPPLLGHELPAEHEWTQTLLRCSTASLGTAPPVTAAEYPCDAFINQRAFGMPTLVFGPRGAGPHNANEYVEVRSVLQTAEALLTTALEWCNG
jgi:acetylornithine deacetylase